MVITNATDHKLYAIGILIKKILEKQSKGLQSDNSAEFVSLHPAKN